MDSDIIRNKYFSRKWFVRAFDIAAVPAIIVLVGVCAFGLGRLSALQEGRGRVVIHPAEDINAVATPTPATDAFLKPSAATDANTPHNFVASKSGSKYYKAGCSGASRISQANEVWFATAAAAQAAGYTEAANCK